MDKPNKFIYQPDYAVSPGEVLTDELEARGMTQQELATRSGLSPGHIVSIAEAKAAITPDTARKFERALGMPAEFWINLEARYHEVLARLQQEEQFDKGGD